METEKHSHHKEQGSEPVEGKPNLMVEKSHEVHATQKQKVVDKPGEKRSDERLVDESHGVKPSELKQSEQSEKKPSETQYEQKPEPEEKPSEKTQYEQKPEERLSEKKASEEKPSEEQVLEETNVVPLAEEKPSETHEPVEEPSDNTEELSREKKTMPSDQQSSAVEEKERPKTKVELQPVQPVHPSELQHVQPVQPSDKQPSAEEIVEKERPKTRAEVQPPPEQSDKKALEEARRKWEEGSGGEKNLREVGKGAVLGEKLFVQNEVKSDIVKRSHGDLDKNTTIPTTTVDRSKGAEHSYYEIVISTGEEAGAATFDRGMYIVLEGTRASSGKQYIRKLFSRAATKGTTDVLQLEASSDLGDILVAVVGNDEPWMEMLTKPWFVEYIAVHNFQSKETMTFPCYHWITSGSWVSLTSRTTLPKEISDNGVLNYHRKTMLDQRRKIYLWQEFPQTLLPSGMDTSLTQLPNDEEFGNVKNLNFVDEVQKTPLVQLVKRIHFENLRDFEIMAEKMAGHEVRVPLYEAGRWTRDEEFGDLLMNGVNPFVLSKCVSIPENFHVTTEMVQGSLSRGKSLEDEIKDGHVYICDLKILDGLPCRENSHCSAPLCLLYVNGYNKLVPIAIQLKQKPGQDNPVFLPSDRWIDWLLAKIHFQNAFAQFHLLVSHYFACHFIMETFIVATMRNLPDSHPIFKLLRPHMRTTLSVNWRVRETLFNDGGLFDQILSIGGEGKNELIRRAAREYNFLQWNNIEKSLKERGVDNKDELPGFYYRDDGLLLVGALKKYVEGVISLFYQSDEDVSGDSELRNWLDDIHTHGCPKRGQSKPDFGIPKEITSKEQLIELCTTIIYTASGLHASVTAPMFRQYSFVPNAPLSMSRPPPTKKGVADIKTLMASLPEEETAAKSVAILHILTQYNSNESYTGFFPYLAAFNYQWFTEPKAKELIVNLRSDLDAISLHIRERNRVLDEPYTALIPDLVPSSITI